MIGYSIDWQPASDDGAGAGWIAEMTADELDAFVRMSDLFAAQPLQAVESMMSEPCEHCDGTGETGWGQDFQMSCSMCHGSGRTAQPLHNISGMEAGGLLMMPEPEQSHSDATGVA